MAQAREHSALSACMDLMLFDPYLRRVGCLSALLRVPRAARSSLTCAKRSGNPLGGARPATDRFENQAPQLKQHSLEQRPE